MAKNRKAIKLVIFLIVCFFSVNIYAQDQKKVLTLSEIQANGLLSYEAKTTGILDPYLMCLAASRDNDSLCEMTRDPEYCRKMFNQFNNYYRELILTGVVSSKVIKAYIAGEVGKHVQGAQLMANAFLAKDPQICQSDKKEANRKFCTAVITRDTGMCSDITCSVHVGYCKAVEEMDPKKCQAIKDEDIKMLCIGATSLNESACEKCQGFKRFNQLFGNQVKPNPTVQEKPFVFKKEGDENE